MADLRSFSLADLEELVVTRGEPRFRARQLYEWLWAKSVTDLDAMSNLPKALRDQLQAEFSLHTLTVDQLQHSFRQENQNPAFDPGRARHRK